MASSSGVQQAQPQHFQQSSLEQQQNNPHQCKDCGLYLNSAESLEVHKQYHKENLLKNWAMQAATEETNNNTTKTNIKREFISNNTIAAADSSDSSQKKSPEYSRTTPENIYGHPPTPQSYQSGSSPYQNQDNSAFSPNFANYQSIKTERTSPTPHQFQNNYPNYNEQQQQFFQMDSNAQYAQDYPVHKAPVQNSSFRYHPYGGPAHSPYERPQSQGQVSSSSNPAYPPQPTPSPSPKQCDKCGYVCESATQLIEHLNIAHPPTPASHLAGYPSNQHFMFGNEHQQTPQIKTEEDAQSEILDLDSQKVVHPVYPEEEKRSNGEQNGHNPHSVSAMLNSWSPPQQQQQQQQLPHPAQQAQQQKMYEQQRMFMGSPPEQKLFQQQNIPNNIPESKMFSSEQKVFQPHQVHNQEFMGNGVTTTSQENPGMGQLPIAAGNYRPFEHLPSQPNAPVISSSQVPNTPTPTAPQKAANWKSNEARRPKTYNCTACNKWFTSSGHLKRHYNTTLHKNAVKSSGHPDPASLPISAHHHPARDSASNREESNHSNSPGEEMRGEDTNSMPPQFERPTTMPGHLQQPPNGPYDRQPAPNIHQTPPLHSPMPHSPMSHSPMPNSPMPNPSPLGNHLMNPNMSNLSNGSPPNGDAGLSPNNLDSRGLLLNSPPINMVNTPHGYSMAPPMMPMENNQFQMYPNELAPHVTQAMVINNHNITGEFQYNSAIGDITSLMPQQSEQQENQPLPSFSQFNRYSLWLSCGNANVGGGVSATAPYSFTNDSFEISSNNDSRIIYRNDDDYKLTVLTAADPAPFQDEFILGYPAPNNNNTLHHNTNDLLAMAETKMQMDDLKMRLEVQPASPEKAQLKRDKVQIKRDYEEGAGSPLISSTVITKTGVNKCFDCDKLFNKACYLTQHNKTFHSGDKPFKCTRCGKRFSCEVTYQEHLTKHAGEKPHKCELCPKQFNHKTDLRRHMCLHTGQKPYACDTCGKGFIRKDHMMKHCETHLRKTQSKIAAMR